MPSFEGTCLWLRFISSLIVFFVRWSMLCTWSTNNSVAISAYALLRWKDEKAINELVSQFECNPIGSSSGLSWTSYIPTNISASTYRASCDKYELLLLTRAMGARLSLSEHEDFTPCRSSSDRVCVVSVVPQLVSFSDVDICTCPAFVFMTAPQT